MKKTVIAIAGTAVLAGGVVVPGALGSSRSTKHKGSKLGPAVTVQVKTSSKTLLNKTAHGEKGWVTKGGAPKGKCPGSSALGALDQATRGRWTGKYYPSVGGIFVTSIERVKPKGKDYWELVVDGKVSSNGACAVTLHRGMKILFKIAK